MAAKVSSEDFRRLRDYIEEHCGIALGEEKAYLIETRLTKLMVENGCDDFGQFYNVIKRAGNGPLRDKIVDAMTTNETLWFRDGHPYDILREKLLPDLVAEMRAGKRNKIRIWSAASSTGQEPYSLAITVREFCRTNSSLRPEQVEIQGTDISPSALFIAMGGRYDPIAMRRGMTPEIEQRYFKQDGRVSLIDDSVKKMVTFKKFNLQDSPVGMGHFDIVFLRYVAIYFSDDLKRKVFNNLAQVLRPKGFLFLGGVESLRGYSDAFTLLTQGRGTYYQCGS